MSAASVGNVEIQGGKLGQWRWRQVGTNYAENNHIHVQREKDSKHFCLKNHLTYSGPTPSSRLYLGCLLLICCFGSYCLEHFAIDPACIDHYARTVLEWTKDNTVSFGLRDMIRRFCDCLGR